MITTYVESVPLSAVGNLTRFNIFVETLERVAPLIFATYLVQQHQETAPDLRV
jgi:hypothetical protein